MRGYKIFSGSASVSFSQKVVKSLGVPLSDISIFNFSDGEVGLQISESVRGLDVFVIQTTSTPANDNIMELLLVCDALKRSSANSITAIIPYFAYARQDRKAAPRVPISAKLVADILQTSGINRVVTMDLHSGQIQGFFNIPVDNLYGSIIFLDYLRDKDLTNYVVVSPDAGGVARARNFAKKLGLDIVIVDKRRISPNRSKVLNIIGDVDGRDVMLVDDIVDTAGTIINAAKLLKEKGALSITSFCTHGVLSKNSYKKIEKSDIDEMIITDTIKFKGKSSKIKVLSVADIFAEVIRRIYHNESVNSLFM